MCIHSDKEVLEAHGGKEKYTLKGEGTEELQTAREIGEAAKTVAEKLEDKIAASQKQEKIMDYVMIGTAAASGVIITIVSYLLGRHSAKDDPGVKLPDTV